MVKGPPSTTHETTSRLRGATPFGRELSDFGRGNELALDRTKGVGGLTHTQNPLPLPLTHSDVKGMCRCPLCHWRNCHNGRSTLSYRARDLWCRPRPCPGPSPIEDPENKVGDCGAPHRRAPLAPTLALRRTPLALPLHSGQQRRESTRRLGSVLGQPSTSRGHTHCEASSCTDPYKSNKRPPPLERPSGDKWDPCAGRNHALYREAPHLSAEVLVACT